MATIHDERLDGWWKSAAFWGILGTYLAIRHSLPLPWTGTGILAGTAGGAAMAWWLGKLNTRAAAIADCAFPLALAAGLYGLSAAGKTKDLPPISFLALGGLIHSAKTTAFGLLGARAIKRLNERNADWLAKLGPPARRTGPPPAADLSETALKLIAALPEPLTSELRAKLKPVTAATPFRSLESVSPAASFLSGNPLLDPALAWPLRAGKPLEFLAQLNLADLPPTGHTRPDRGLLAFFYDAEAQPWGDEADDRDGTVVLYSPDPLRARPAMKPGGPPHPPIRKPLAFRQTPWLELSLIDDERIEHLCESASDAAGARLVSELHLELQNLDPPGPHRVLSAPRPVQDEMDDELAAAARILGLAAGSPWTLLLQLDSDRDLGWQWGDMGCLYFWIPDEDLAAGRFDRVWTILQCT